MPLGAADLTRIYKYRAFTLGSRAGGPLTYNTVMALLNEQITTVNDTDTALGTTFATQIQADLDQLDTLDAARTSNAIAGNGAVKILGIEDGIEYFQGGQQLGYTREMEMLRKRIARVLSQTYGEGPQVTMSYRG